LKYSALENKVNHTIYRVIKMITANDLKTKGIACLEESLADQPEAVITVRGKGSFVVMKIEHYHYLREMELEATLYEAQTGCCSGPVQ
jgi:prevent-host-death family protein